MQQTINNGESGLSVRGKLNSMFGELYSGLPNVPTILRNQTGAITQNVIADTYISSIFIKKISGTTTIKIGTTLGGNDICDTAPIDSIPLLIKVEQTFIVNTTLYFTITGLIDIRIESISNLF